MSTFAIGLSFIAVGIALNLLFPPELPDQEGFRLDDLRISGSAYGKPRNLSYGTVKVNGNIFWGLDIKEVINSETVGENIIGKGGATVTTYAYFGTFAIGFGEGLADHILKIWANRKLIYDSTAPTGSSDTVSNGKYPITFYPGSATQLPDPDIELNEGVGNTPAYRGEVYFVAKDWPLKDFGNGIPNITAQITYAGSSVNPVDFFDITNTFVVPGGSLISSTDEWITINPFTGEAITISETGAGFLNRSIDKSSTEASMDFSATQTVRQALHNPVYDDIMYSWFGNITDLIGPNDIRTRRKFNIRTGEILHEWNLPPGQNTCTLGPPCHLRIGSSELGVGEVDLILFLHQSGGVGAAGAGRQDLTCFLDRTEANLGMVEVSIGTIGQSFSDTTSVEVPIMSDWFSKRHFILCQTSTSYRLYEFKGSVIIDEVGSLSGNPFLEQKGVDIAKSTFMPSGGSSIVGYCFLPNEDALIVSNGTSMTKFTYDDFGLVTTRSTLGFKAIHNWTLSNRFAFADGDHDSSTGGAGFYVISTDDLSTVSFTDKIAPLTVGTELVGASAYDSRTHSLVISQGLGISLPPIDELLAEVFLERATGGGVLLSDIVTDLSLRAGFDASDLDVTDLTDTVVDGYTITKEATYRSMIEPLQRVYFFEGVESDWKVKFVDRGKAPLVTIPEEDVGTLKSNDFKLIETYINDIELPGKVIMNFIDKDRDMESNTAIARRTKNPLRTQFSENDIEFDVTIVMDSTTAAQATEKSMYTAWAERIQLASELSWEYLKYDPTDIVTVIFNGESRRVRLSKFNIGADLSISFEATQEDSKAHISTLTGFGGDGHKIQALPPLGTAFMIPIDSPLQLDADATLLQSSRSYYAFASLNTNAVLYRSLDTGQTYNAIDGNNTEATWGFVSGSVSLPTSSVNVWDDTNTITIVPIDRPERIVSSTDLAVLNGANAIAIEHSSGGVEIIQFVTAVDNGDGSFTLSRLLRGRRGTEDISLQTNTKIGPRFVFLSTGIRAFTTPLDKLGIALPYRAVPSGYFLTDVPVVSAQYNGEDLIPYSVAHLKSVISGGNRVVTWVRRTRHLGELQDLTDTVPLNEDSELYDVEYFRVEDPTTVKLTRTDLTSPTDTITNTEYSTSLNDGQPSNQITFFDWNFETTIAGSFPDGWVRTGGILRNMRVVTAIGSLTGPPTGGGSQFLGENGFESTNAFAYFDIDLIGHGFEADDLDKYPTVGYDVYLGQPDDVNDDLSFKLEFYDESMTLISSLSTGTQNIAAGTWTNFVNSTALPLLTRTIRARFDILPGSGSLHGAIDSIKVTLGVDQPKGVLAKVYQKSHIKGRGRATQTRI